MRNSILALAFGLWASWAPNVDAQAPQKEIGSTISGKVTIEGAAAPNVAVSVETAGTTVRQPPISRTRTDANGKYRMTCLPSGRYQVSVIMPAFVDEASTGQYNGGKSLIVRGNETVEGVDFSLRHGGVITGRVTDGSGRPIVGTMCE